MKANKVKQNNPVTSYSVSTGWPKSGGSNEMTESIAKGKYTKCKVRSSRSSAPKESY